MGKHYFKFSWFIRQSNEEQYIPLIETSLTNPWEIASNRRVDSQGFIIEDIIIAVVNQEDLASFAELIAQKLGVTAYEEASQGEFESALNLTRWWKSDDYEDKVSKPEYGIETFFVAQSNETHFDELTEPENALFFYCRWIFNTERVKQFPVALERAKQLGILIYKLTIVRSSEGCFYRSLVLRIPSLKSFEQFNKTVGQSINFVDWQPVDRLVFYGRGQKFNDYYPVSKFIGEMEECLATNDKYNC